MVRMLVALSAVLCLSVAQAWISTASLRLEQRSAIRGRALRAANSDNVKSKTRVTIIGAGWGGLSAAHTLSKDPRFEVTIVEASPRVGGLVRDGFSSMSGKRPAEAGQHGFWNNYHNIYRLLNDEIEGFRIDQALTDFAEQGQYSPKRLEAVWPVYQNQSPKLPTGLAQAVYTKFLNLSVLDRLTVFPLVLAFCEFLQDEDAYSRFDSISFRDLCSKLGVSKRAYDEAFEPMILTGLFAPGSACSAAAAMGMAYFFVLQSQEAFDVQWCRGNVGEVIFEPWVQQLQRDGVKFQCSTRVSGFAISSDDRISQVKCLVEGGNELVLDTDQVIFAVGAKALNGFSRFCPELSKYEEFRKFANLRGTSVLATRLFLDRSVVVPYSANACWGFDKGVGMTMFDIKAIHGAHATTVADAPGAVLEVDYYHAKPLLVMNDDDIVKKVKKDLDTILGATCQAAQVVDAAVVRLDEAVNWYEPGSHSMLPSLLSSSIQNAAFCGDICKSDHGSWSQEKAFVTGKQVANFVRGRDANEDVIPLAPNELHVELGKRMVDLGRTLLGGGNASRGPSLTNFLW